MEPTTRPLQVTLPLQAKTYDVDFAGIVHNLVYIRWLEDLRLQLLAEYLPLAQLLAQEVGPILTRTEIDYRLPLRLGDTATGRMWVSALSRVRWTVQAEIVLPERVAATATQQGFFADMENLKPVRIPARLREKWEQSR